MSDLYTARLLAIPPSLFFLVPLAAIVLVLLVLGTHRPIVARTRTVVLVSCAVAALTVISILAGAVGLRATTGPFALTTAESMIQSVLEFSLGMSSLYLVRLLIPSRLYASFLVLLLESATLTNLIAPFVSVKTMPAVIPRVLVLLFSFCLLPLLALILLRMPTSIQPAPFLPAPLPSPAASATSFPSQQTHVQTPTHEKTPSLDSILTVTAVDHSPPILDPESLSPPEHTHTTLHAQETHTGLRALVTILLAAQISAFLACVLDVVGVAGRAAFNTRTQALLRIVQIAFAVLCVVFILGAYMHSLYVTHPNKDTDVNSARSFELASSPRARAAAAVARAMSTAGPADRYYYPPEIGFPAAGHGRHTPGERDYTPGDRYRTPDHTPGDRYRMPGDRYYTPPDKHHQGKTNDASWGKVPTNTQTQTRHTPQTYESRYTPVPRRVHRKATPVYTSEDFVSGVDCVSYPRTERRDPSSHGGRQHSPNTNTNAHTSTRISPKIQGQTRWPRLNSLSAKVPPPLSLRREGSGGFVMASSGRPVMRSSGELVMSSSGELVMGGPGVPVTDVLASPTNVKRDLTPPKTVFTPPRTVPKAKQGTYAPLMAMALRRPLKAMHARFSSASSSFSSPDIGREMSDVGREVSERVMDLECDVMDLRPEYNVEGLSPGCDDGDLRHGRGFPPERFSVVPFPTSIPSVPSGESPPLGFGSIPTTPASASSSCFPTSSSSTSCLPTTFTSSTTYLPTPPSSTSTHTPPCFPALHNPSTLCPPKPKPKAKRAAKHMSVRVTTSTSYRFPFPFPKRGSLAGEGKNGSSRKWDSNWAYGGYRDGIRGDDDGIDAYGNDGNGIDRYWKYRGCGDRTCRGENHDEDDNGEDVDGFMDLRDPFACPTGVVVRHSSVVRESGSTAARNSGAVRDSVPSGGVIRDSGISMVERLSMDGNGNGNGNGSLNKGTSGKEGGGGTFDTAEFGVIRALAPVKERTSASASAWGKLPVSSPSLVNVNVNASEAGVRLGSGDISHHGDGGSGTLHGSGFNTSQGAGFNTSHGGGLNTSHGGGFNTSHGGGFGTSINMAMMGGIAFAGRLGRGRFSSAGGSGLSMMNVYAGGAYPSPSSSLSSSSRGSKASKGSVASKMSKGSKIPRMKGGVPPTASSLSSSSSRVTGRKQGTLRSDVYTGSKEDVDFDVEEALLAQRLLRRLNGMGDV